MDPATARRTEFATLDHNAGPHGIDVDANGTVWYAATAVGKIGRLDANADRHREYEIAEEPIDPHSILAHGTRVWFTAPRSNAYGYLDAATGEITRLEPPHPASAPYGLAAAPDGSTWITFSNANHLGRVSAGTDEITLFELPEGTRPQRISVDGEGAVWYTDRMGHRIGRLDPGSGQVRSFPTRSDRAFPLSIVAGARGGVWYYEEGTGRLVWMHPECDSESAITLDRPGVIIRHMVLDPATDDIWVALGELPGVARVSMRAVEPCASVRAADDTTQYRPR